VLDGHFFSTKKAILQKKRFTSRISAMTGESSLEEAAAAQEEEEEEEDLSRFAWS